MMIIPNSRFQQEAEQTEAVKQSEKAVESKPSAGVEKHKDSEGVQKAETISVRQREFDQYIPKKAEEEKSYGHYEVVPDGEGHSKVRFDNPQKDLEEKISADQVKAEDSSSLGQGPKLQKLKKKQQQLKQKLRSETDAGKTEELKRKLVQIEREIRAAEK